jgi:putative nucleotidyltransferase-like protein
LLSTLEHLHEAGVDKIVLLKGMAMILNFYNDFGVRVIGDVDILIRKEHLKIAAPLLRAEGWEQNVSHLDLENEEHLKRWHALNFTHPTGLRLDLHWSFIEENSPPLDEAVLRDAAALNTKGLYIPTPTDLLLQTCIHGVKYSPVPLIRWVADAVTLLKVSKIEWDRFIELATQARICRPLYFALQYLADPFEAPIPPSVIRRLKEHTATKLESLESACALPELAAWYRYCLNRGYLTRRARLSHLIQYLQTTARLKSAWMIPPFAIYWICKRIYRYLYRSCFGKNTAPFSTKN